jgi:dUTPase
VEKGLVTEMEGLKVTERNKEGFGRTGKNKL